MDPGPRHVQPGKFFPHLHSPSATKVAWVMVNSACAAAWYADAEAGVEK